jgi:hypothetical protein
MIRPQTGRVGPVPVERRIMLAPSIYVEKTEALRRGPDLES